MCDQHLQRRDSRVSQNGVKDDHWTNPLEFSCIGPPQGRWLAGEKVRTCNRPAKVLTGYWRQESAQSDFVAQMVSLLAALRAEQFHHAPKEEDFPGLNIGESARTTIMWKVFHPNLVGTATTYEGVPETHFQRTAQAEHDVALGQALTSGIHEWVVTSPNWSPNSFVGVAEAACDTRTYPAAPGCPAWAMQLHSGDLCSGVAAINPMGLARGGRLVNARRASKNTKGKRNDKWENLSVPPDTPVRVIIDMDARALYFGVADEEPELAYMNLPAVLHPYICSGDMGEKSLMIASSY